MAITLLPTPPTRSSPTNFAALADTFLAALPQFAIDVNNQQALMMTTISATGSGTSDAITATFTPAIAAVTAGLIVYVRATGSNTTTTPTFSPSGLTAATIVKTNGVALRIGDIKGPGHWLSLQYDATLSQWILLNPALIAASGANSDITSLSGLTSALSIAQGGTGAITANAGADALGAFRRGTLLGTVSQTAGVPTGSVIETGTNANGTYTRFADGSQICTMGFPDIACPASAYVSLANRSYPAAFIATPAMSYSCNPQTTYDFFGFVASNASLASCQPVIRNGGTAQNAILIFATAVGRWF